MFFEATMSPSRRGTARRRRAGGQAGRTVSLCSPPRASFACAVPLGEGDNKTKTVLLTVQSRNLSFLDDDLSVFDDRFHLQEIVGAC